MTGHSVGQGRDDIKRLSCYGYSEAPERILQSLTELSQYLRHVHMGIDERLGPQ